MAGIGTDIEIHGLEELQKKLKPDELLGKAVKELMHEAALTVVKQAKINAPVDTGILESSITHSISPAPIPTWAKVGTNVQYASFVEKGRGRPRGKGIIPFFFPAVRQTKEKVDSLIKKAAKMIEERFPA